MNEKDELIEKIKLLGDEVVMTIKERDDFRSGLVELRTELNEYKDCRHDLLDKVDQLKADLDTKQTLIEEFVRKDRQLCEQNGTLLMDTYEAQKIIQAFSNHDDYIGRKTVMQVADEWLASHPKE